MLEQLSKVFIFFFQKSIIAVNMPKSNNELYLYKSHTNQYLQSRRLPRPANTV
ncbi:Uncharacterized protein dnm_088190 [Desulfonema magnum]|uniref:Uncharacterized protein n=1 Tax=Desulfonema magnum TaxID=45655 RepID=A0A975GT46_9BACT|nr:Uncharacterized protein dnm_088190 [Desulfonema magnum]